MDSILMDGLEDGPANERHVRYEVLDLVSDQRVGFCDAAFRLRTESLVSEHGCELVLDHFETALQSVPISPERLQLILSTLLQLAAIYKSSRAPTYRIELLNMVSNERIDASITAFSADVQYHVLLGRADLAISALLTYFNWMKTEKVNDAGNLYIVAAYACNCFGQHDLASQYSYLEYNRAQKSGSEYAVGRANFFVLNSNRLSFGKQISLQFDYDAELRKLESGSLQLVRSNQFLLPLFAASEELAQHSPDVKRAKRLVDSAREIGDMSDSYVECVWFAVTGYMSLVQGDKAAARNALDKAECLTSNVDTSLELMLNDLSTGLGLPPKSRTSHVIPASNSAWQALRCHAAHFWQSQNILEQN